MKYKVYQKFETFGDDSESVHDSREQAEKRADILAEEIADCLYPKDSNGDSEIEYYSSAGKTGYSSEIKFHTELSDYADATEDKPGKMPWSDVVGMIRKAAIVIEEVKDNECPT